MFKTGVHYYEKVDDSTVVKFYVLAIVDGDQIVHKHWSVSKQHWKYGVDSRRFLDAMAELKFVASTRGGLK